MSRVITLEVSEDDFKCFCEAHHRFQNEAEMNTSLEEFIGACAIKNAMALLEPYTTTPIPELN